MFTRTGEVCEWCGATLRVDGIASGNPGKKAIGMKTCPNCGAPNPDYAVSCDCIYEFPTQSIDGSPPTPQSHVPSRRWLLTSLDSALKNMSVTSRRWLVMAVLTSFGVALALFSNSERFVWQVAESKNNVEDYERYISQFPEGEHAQEARERLLRLTTAEQSAWENLRNSPTLELAEAYLNEYPDGRHIEEAKEMLGTKKEEAEVSRLKSLIGTNPKEALQQSEVSLKGIPTSATMAQKKRYLSLMLEAWEARRKQDQPNLLGVEEAVVQSLVTSSSSLNVKARASTNHESGNCGSSIADQVIDYLRQSSIGSVVTFREPTDTGSTRIEVECDDRQRMGTYVLKETNRTVQGYLLRVSISVYSPEQLDPILVRTIKSGPAEDVFSLPGHVIFSPSDSEMERKLWDSALKALEQQLWTVMVGRSSTGG